MRQEFSDWDSDQVGIEKIQEKQNSIVFLLANSSGSLPDATQEAAASDSSASWNCFSSRKTILCELVLRHNMERVEAMDKRGIMNEQAGKRYRCATVVEPAATLRDKNFPTGIPIKPVFEIYS